MEERETASRFCSILASLFGESLERTTLWAKIGAALKAACAQVADGDLDRYVAICLHQIVADDALVAASEPLLQVLQTYEPRLAEQRQRLISYIDTHHYAVLVRGRKRWQDALAAKAAMGPNGRLEL